MRLREEPNAYGAWTAPVAGPSITLSSGDGLKTVDVQLKDLAGNATTLSAQITLDSTLPTGSINFGGVSVTNLTPLSLTISASDTISSSGIDKMRFSEKADFSDAPAWLNYATSANFVPSAGDGLKTVYAQFKDLAGNQTSSSISASITLDQTPPTGALYINSGASVTTVPGVMLTLAASDNLSGPAYMRFSAINDFTDITWQTYKPSQAFTLTAPDGTKNVYAQVQDAAGNASSTITATIVLDTTSPTGSVTITPKPFATVSGVTLTLSQTGALSMRVSKSSTFPGADATWIAFAASKAWTLSAGDGPKTVYAQFQDAHGNLSPVYSDSTLLDTTLPVGQLYINGGAAVTAVPAVKLFNTFTETGSGVSQYRVADTSGDLATATWIAFVNPADYTLPAGDGVKTVWIQLKDTAGNLSAAFSDTITLDSTAPGGSVVINGGAVNTYSPAVTLSLVASDTLSPQAQLQMQVSNDSGFSGAVWQPFKASMSWTLLPGLGSHTVYARYRDAAGNLSVPVHTQIKVLAAFFIPIVLK
jgi:hypothetical protein